MISKRKRWRLSALLGSLSVAILIAAVVGGNAQAAFTGANGKIVFVRGADSGHGQLWTVNPDGSGLAPLIALPGVIVFLPRIKQSSVKPYRGDQTMHCVKSMDPTFDHANLCFAGRST